jgi:hypothetical protein
MKNNVILIVFISVFPPYPMKSLKIIIEQKKAKVYKKSIGFDG